MFTWCILSGERLKLGSPNIEKMKKFVCDRICDRGKLLKSVLEVKKKMLYLNISIYIDSGKNMGSWWKAN